MTHASSIRDIVDFWFLRATDPGYGKPREIWWRSTPAVDAEIASRFGALSDAAIGGNLDAWTETPEGALALILLCDQFPRNIHRRSARAFSGDAKALAMARLALARAYPSQVDAALRLFFYMPFEHSEALADQEMACVLFGTLGNEDYVKSAHEHRDIVARFGRFPHRNDVLGRASTPDEIAYLTTAKRFGQ